MYMIVVWSLYVDREKERCVIVDFCLNSVTKREKCNNLSSISSRPPLLVWFITFNCI